MYKFSVLEKFVGFFVFVSLILVIVLVLFLGRAGEWFRPSVDYYTLLDDISDISIGKKIYYRGIVIGKVSRVSIYDEKRFKVDLYIYSEYTNIVRSDSLIIVRSELLGGKKFELVPGGHQSRVLERGEMIHSLDTYEGKVLAKLKGYYFPQEDMNKIISNVALITSYLVEYVREDGELKRILGNVNNILRNVEISVKGVNYEALPALNSVLNQRIPLLVDNLVVVLDQLEAILEQQSVSNSLRNIEKITKDISGITDSLNQRIPLLVDSLMVVLDQLEVLLKQQSLSNSLKNIEKITKDISDITDSLSGSKSNISNVIYNLERLTKNLSEILEIFSGK